MEYIAIGTITKPHGIHGAVSVKTDSDFKETRYKAGNTLYIHVKETYRPVTVAHHASKRDRDILTFSEYETIEAVRPLQNCVLYIAATDRHSLSDDEYYASELIGLSVIFQGRTIGVVKAVRHYPQGEVLVVDRTGMKDAFVPFRKEFVSDVSDEAVTITPIEGLL